jgi:type IV secretory pathway component VirB8
MTFVLATALVVLVALGMTIYNMFPLNRPQVFFLTTTVRDNQDVRLVQMQPKSENLDRYTKAFVREYIRHRNEIFENPNAMHQKWNSANGDVRIMSTDDVYAGFADTALFNAIMSEAPSFNCWVTFDGAPMYLASEDAYQVEFRYFCSDSTGHTAPKDYTIKLKLETEDNAQIKWADRVDNPLGLRVSEYEIVSGNGDPLDTGFLNE